MFNRKYIFKGSIFHCYVSLPEGNNKRLLSCFFPKKYPWLQHCSTLLTLLCSKTLGTTPPKMNEFLPKTDHVQRLFHLPTIDAYRLLRDMLEKFFHLPTIDLGDMLVGGSSITLVQDSSGTLACVFQAPGERVHPFQEKRKSVMKDRGHYITNPNKALLSGNTSNLPCIRIV